MKKSFILFISGFVLTLSVYSQARQPYVTAGGEMLFSFANINDHGTNPGSTLRWAPIINLQSVINRDLSSNFGLFGGISMRNVGYIYDSFTDNFTDPLTARVYKKKFRSYNLGLPVGIKIGDMDGMLLYGGYEIELPFLYKEKTFEGGDKISKITGWFSNRENLFQHGFFVGVEFPYGFDLKFKYYLSEFHNRDFVDSGRNKPYEGLKSNVFYISIGSYLFKSYHFNSMSHNIN
jgi:hypothetical protein